LKLSKGKVVQGYEEQLETYKAAAQTEEALFLIIDVGKMGTKLTKIMKIQKARLSKGERTADIVVVDAKRSPPPASADPMAQIPPSVIGTAAPILADWCAQAQLGVPATACAWIGSWQAMTCSLSRSTYRILPRSSAA
jgi:hypothetical protein